MLLLLKCILSGLITTRLVSLMVLTHFVFGQTRAEHLSFYLIQELKRVS